MFRQSTSANALSTLVFIVMLGVVAGCSHDDLKENTNHEQNTNKTQHSAACGTHRWCNSALSPDRRADLLMAKLTRKEKFQLLSTGTRDGSQYGSIPRLGIPPLYLTDGAAGIRLASAWRSGSGAKPSVEPPPDKLPTLPGRNTATAWPAPIALAATWNPDLAYKYGAAIGEEAQALGIGMVLGPNVNIMRTPLGGRTFEAYGEDPELTSRMGVAWIKGLQSKGVIADVKHYVANNQEYKRFYINENISERALRAIYLPAFHAAVKKADVGSVMLAYNSVNCDWMTENKTLVQDILKQEWGFEGFTISDSTVAMHSTIAALKAGTDLELGSAYYTPAKLSKAVKNGKISMENINNHVHRILRTRFAFGMFDTPHASPETSRIPMTMRRKHAELARRIEEAAITLLKNKNDTLPLNAENLTHIAVIGSLANRYKAGLGSSFVKPAYAVDPLQGIRNRVDELGVKLTYYGGKNHAKAAQKASKADVAIVVVADFETESGDRPCLQLDCQSNKTLTDQLRPNGNTFAPFPDFPQNGLVKAVAQAQPNTIVVVEAGAPVLMPWIDLVPAVLYTYYPGQEGGTAIASVLFGDVNPSGHLPFTIPAEASDLGHLAIFGKGKQYRGVPQNPPVKGDEVQVEVTYTEGIFVGYRHYGEKGIKPLFPFGYGLSYTEFEYSGLSFDLTPSGGVVSVYVANVGDRPGAAVAQLYLGLPETRVPQPPKWLRDFEKVQLGVGESELVKFKVSARDLSYWDVNKNSWEVAPGCYKVMVGASVRDIKLSGKRASKEMNNP